MRICEMISEDRLDGIIKMAIRDDHDIIGAGYEHSETFALALLDLLLAGGVKAWPKGLRGGEGSFDFDDDFDEDEADTHELMYAQDKAEYEVEPDGSILAWLVAVPGMENDDSGYGVDGLFWDYDEIQNTYAKNEDCAGLTNLTRADLEEAVRNSRGGHEWYSNFKRILGPPVAQWLSAPKRAKPLGRRKG